MTKVEKARRKHAKAQKEYEGRQRAMGRKRVCFWLDDIENEQVRMFLLNMQKVSRREDDGV